MSLRPLLFWLARLYFGGFLLMTSAYCLLTYIPFTYHQFLKAADLLPWLTTFVKWHPYFYWTALAIVACTLLPDLRRPGIRVVAQAFLVCNTIAGILLLLDPLLPRLGNDSGSLGWSLAALVPLAWLAAIDLGGSFKSVQWGRPDDSEDRRVFRVTWQSAVCLSVVYAAVFERTDILGSAGVYVGSRDWLSLVGWSTLSHLLAFMALFAVLNLIRALASWCHTPARAEFLLLNLLTAVLLWLALRGMILPAISFTGTTADLYSAVVSVIVAGYLSGLSIRLYRIEEGDAASGLDVQLTALTICRRPAKLAKVISILLVCGMAYGLSIQTAVMDWNYLFRKLAAAMLWTATFACLYRLRLRLRWRMRWNGARTRSRAPILLLAPLAVIGAYRTILASNFGVSQALVDQYAAHDASFKLITDMLARPRDDGVFYGFLARNANIPSSRRVAPVDVTLASNRVPFSGPKPNIFIFVIDSLRQDYLSPYNPAVTFTPDIESFARESIVMKNAFTRYGGTGLSEPALWAGGMLLHKQYVLPFWPMNALAKLVQSEKYQSYISADTILSTILGDSLAFTELDKNVLNMNYDFGRSLDDLAANITRAKTPEPFFAYTQPQNLHVSVIRRQGPGLRPGETYPGFNAPYASRVRKIDEAFGKFIRFLKSRELYGNSIVVLTSDHGDSLGEDGRWGHAYTIFPEVIRIPIIIHLPEKLRNGMTFDANSIAFLTDITPSLYYLLGHRPIERNGIYGRPLFVAGLREQTARSRDSYLIASSYAAVFGLLSGNGRQLYIADAVNHKSYMYDLSPGAAGSGKRVNAGARMDEEKQIEEQILAVNRFYGFSYK